MSRTFRLGLFIAATLSILAVGTFLIGDRRLLFTPKFEIGTTFKNVNGLMEGAEVHVGGINQGIVSKIALPEEPDGDMIVSLKLNRSAASVIREDSRASINTEGLLGTKFVEVSFGSPKAPALENGGTIESTTTLEISDVMKKTGALLDATTQTMATLRGTTAQAKAGVVSFNENMEALKTNFFLRGFFNRRGYEDSSEIGKHDIAQLPKTAPVKTFKFEAKKLFSKPDRAQLSNESPLKDVGRFLESNRYGLVVVIASSGMKGDATEVKTLTQARAMVIRDYLVGNFMTEDSRIKTQGLGKNPDTPNDLGSVEIRVYPASGRTVPPR